MTRHALIIPAAVAVALGIATPAGAHTPAISAACVDGRPVGHVDLVNYPAGATVTVNATTVTFTGAYHHSYDLGDPTVPHDFHVVVVSPDHIGALNETEHTPPCTIPTTTSTSPTSTPTSSSSTSTAPASTAPSSSSTAETSVAPATTATSSPTSAPTSSSLPTSTAPTTSSPTSTTTDVAAAPPAPRPPTPNLPATGTDTSLQLGIGAAVLAAGIGLATIARRRTA